MIRKAFRMKLKAGCSEEYQQRHNPIWPELAAILKEHGVHNYSIYLERTSGYLFAYAEIESEELWEQIGRTEICRRWWSSMSHLMLTNPDHSPIALPLDEVFHLD